MFHVLIADDESSVVQSLLHSVPWDTLNLKVVGTASDGPAALDLAQKERIDIAVLDIRMPGISGLELCARLRQMNEQIQLIIASGHAEFAYAEKAIQYGVLGYCLKPLDYAQITRFLRKAAQNLGRNGHSSNHDDLMEILERQDETEIQECLFQLGLPQQSYFVAVSTSEKKLEALERCGLSLRLGRGQWGYIMRTAPAGWLEAAGCQQCGCSGIGYMQQSVTAKEIYGAFEECIARAFQYFVSEEDKICGSLNECKARPWLNGIQKDIKANDWDGVAVILKEIAQDSWRSFTVRSALRLCNLILSSSASHEEDEDYYIYSVEQLVSVYGCFQEMLRQLQTFLKGNHIKAAEGATFTNAAFMRLMKYINDNYTDEISLASAAQALHMNANYISQLFKKEAGVTFVRYITQKRLESAKELLSATQKPLTDIALDVGFNDYFYFIKTFKKFTGITPGQYRANN